MNLSARRTARGIVEVGSLRRPQPRDTAPAPDPRSGGLDPVIGQILEARLRESQPWVTGFARRLGLPLA